MTETCQPWYSLRPSALILHVCAFISYLTLLSDEIMWFRIIINVV